jgi:amidase
MKRATRDILYFETGPDNEPTLHVSPGEEFEVESQLNRVPWLDDHPDGDSLRKKLRAGNPSSGCIYVDGAEPGQTLIVHIGEIDLDPIGFTSFRGANGAMPGWLGGSGIGAHHKVVEIKDRQILWSDSLKIPVAPMLGVVGVAQANTRWTNAWAGQWGGNFDIQEVTTGASVHLPISVPGARVRITCELAERPASMTWPRITNATHIMTTAMARPAEDAFRTALEEMVLWLEDDYGFTKGEGYLFLGQVLEARCTQFVNPTFSYVAKVDRKYLPPR